MSNKKRRREPNLTYHIFSRCADLAHLMEPRQMKDLMIEVIHMALNKYHFELLSYVIMDNHFHFFIKTIEGEADISRIMQFIKAQYARRYNKITGRKGPFWNERFGDTIVEESEDPDFTFNYINIYMIYNPVRAGYVSDPRNYNYGCIDFYLYENYNSPLKLTFHHSFLRLGNTFEERTRQFLEFVEMYRKRIIPECLFK